MNPRIDILGPEELERVSQPVEGMAAVRARYTRTLVAEGAHRLIENADVEARALKVDDTLWPLVLANPGARNCDACSPFTWYARYVPAETANRRGTLAGVVSSARHLPMKIVLGIGGVDRVVYVNNWLLATNPSHGLAAHCVADVTACLISAWPDRAVVFRSVNPDVDRSGFEALRNAGYRFVRSRDVYLVDTREEGFKQHNNVRVDLTKLEHTPYEIVSDPARLASYTRRMSELYRAVYLVKYVNYNPQLNQCFFERTLSEGVFCYRGLIHEGRLDGMLAFLHTENVMWSLMMGYDVTVDRNAGLYRLLIAIMLREASDHGAVLNLSSGAAGFKVLRGGRAVDEFDAVYDAHLPVRRRLAWSALRAASNRHRIDAALDVG